VAFISAIGSQSPYNSTTMIAKSDDVTQSLSQLTVPYGIYDDSDNELLT